MEFDLTLTTIAIFVIIMLIMFARFSITYQPADGAKPSPTIRRPLINSRTDTNKVLKTDTDKIMKNNDNKPQYSAFGLPPKDAYMSKGLRDQIDTLRSKFYYDNCKYRLLEEFDDCKHPLIKVKEVMPEFM